MRKILSNNYFLGLFSIALFFATACIGAASLSVKTVAVSFIYCLLTLYLVKIKETRKARLIAIMILAGPVVLIEGPNHVMHFDDTLISLPPFVAYLLGIVFGVLIFFSRFPYKIMLGAVLLGLCLFVYIKGFDLWLNKIDYGSYSFKVNEPLPQGFSLKDDNGRPFDLQKNKDKVVVLDFWNTGCGVCFRKFPILQKKHDQYAKLRQVEFYAVNVPVKRDTVGQGIAVFKSLKFDVTNLNAESVKQASNIGILSFPTVLVIDNNRIIFRGDIEDVDKCLKEIL